MNLLQVLKSKGKALIITGPQGSGKTLLARQLVEGLKSSYVSIDQLCGKSTEWMDGIPDVVIVDEVHFKKRQLASLTGSLKQILSNDTISVNRRAEQIKTPTFIFCTGDPEPIKASVGDRRFFVIDMTEKL